jgi:hypothetical protein
VKPGPCWGVSPGLAGEEKPKKRICFKAKEKKGEYGKRRAIIRLIKGRQAVSWVYLGC